MKEETLKHFLIECRLYQRERGEFENYIKQNLGETKWQEIKDTDRSMAYILGFIEEEKINLEETKKFLGKIWKKRNEEEEILEGGGGGDVEHNHFIST